MFYAEHPAHRVEQNQLYDQDLLRLTWRAKGFFFLAHRNKIRLALMRERIGRCSSYSLQRPAI